MHPSKTRTQTGAIDLRRKANTVGKNKTDARKGKRGGHIQKGGGAQKYSVGERTYEDKGRSRMHIEGRNGGLGSRGSLKTKSVKGEKHEHFP